MSKNFVFLLLLLSKH